MNMMSEWSCAEFTERLAAREPVPGGGAAAALAGALGAALGHMALSFTVDKSKYADRRPLLEEYTVRLQELQKRLLAAADEDAVCYAVLNRAYALPRDTAEQRQVRQDAIESALPVAAAPARKVLRLCAETVEILERLADGNCTPALLSDVGCATAMCRAALEMGSINLYVNTRSMSDWEQTKRWNSEAQELLERCLPACDCIAAVIREYLLG